MREILCVKSNDSEFGESTIVVDSACVNMEKYLDQREFANSKMEKQHKKFTKHANCEKLESKIKKNK